MEGVIAAVADAIWPSLPVPDGADEAAYFATSGGSLPGLPAAVLRTIDAQLYGPAQWQLRLLLRALSCRAPTALLGGGLSPRWPFLRAFPELSTAERHAFLAAWARSRLQPLRKAYKALKSIVAASLLSLVDPATGTNPFFPGLGYAPGSRVSEASAGPRPAAADEAEEVLASATLHLPDVLAAGADPRAYLSRRGFHVAAARASSSGQAPPALELAYDAVVAGSGCGGGVAAALLAAAGLRVLVLEKGGWARSKDMSWLEAEAHRSCYERAGFLVTADGSLTMLAGATLGGGSKINWTASLRTPDHVRAEWAAQPGLAALDSAAMDAALDAVCTRLGVSQPPFTALRGPSARLLDGMRALGQHCEELPRNCSSATCHAYCNLGCRSGHKQSSDVTWLVDAVRAGAHILTGAEAQRVLTQPCSASSSSSGSSSGSGSSSDGSNGGGDGCRQQVVGLLALSTAGGEPAMGAAPGARVLVHAPLVVASCGSIHTPALLLRSGIRGGGQVGANLRLHPASGVVAVFDRSSTQQPAVDMYQGVSMGVFSRAACNWEAGGYGAMVSIPAAHPGLLAAISPDCSLGGLKRLFSALPDTAASVVFTRDSGSGRVSIDAAGRPVVNYWPDARTREHLLEGLIAALRALEAAGARRLVVPHAWAGWEVAFAAGASPEQRRAQLGRLIAEMRRTGVQPYDLPLFSAHQMGSCRLGASPAASACDPSGQVWGVRGLYVADASLFPTASGVNPMITAYALAHLTAAGIARRSKQQQQQQQQERPANGASAQQGQ